MSLIGIIVFLLIFGFVAYVLRTAPIPIDPWVRNVIVGVLFIALIIWLLNAAGMSTGIRIR